jgi:hypothetical protein
MYQQAVMVMQMVPEERGETRSDVSAPVLTQVVLHGQDPTVTLASFTVVTTQ